MFRHGYLPQIGPMMKERIEYALVWVLVKGMGLLPRQFARSLAAGLARIAYAFLPKLRRTAQVNLCIAFPAWSDEQRAAVTEFRREVAYDEALLRQEIPVVDDWGRLMHAQSEEGLRRLKELIERILREEQTVPADVPRV